MRWETFFEEFDQLADTPTAVERLRALILRLATTGRIALQDPADQPAVELLREIFALRDALIQEGVTRARIDRDAISAGDDVTLPPSWSRCTISEVCELQTGATPSRQEVAYFGGDIPWLVSGDVNKGHIFEANGRITEDGLANSNCKIVDPDSVLIALNGQGKTRATVAILRIPAALNQSLVSMTPYSRERLLPEYLYWSLRARYYAIREITGQDQRRGLNMKLVARLSLPIPPLAEQQRIVAKVEALMGLCERLEEQQQERQKKQVALGRAALARFADTPSVDNLDLLFHSSYSIDPTDLRKSILALAVQGALVAQDPTDRPVGELVRSARAEANLSGSVRVERENTDGVFRVPPSWGWVRVSDVAESRLGKMLDKEKNRGQPRPYLRNTNVHWFRFELESIKMMLLPDSEFDEYRLNRGDVLICEGGHGIARTAVWDGQIPDVIFQKALHRVRPLACLEGQFLAYCIRVYEGNGFLQRYYTGAGIPHFTGKALARVRFPLPPLAEQHRIIAKVDQLMALVDQLEARLATSRALAVNLLDAIVAELGPARAKGAERVHIGE